MYMYIVAVCNAYDVHIDCVWSVVCREEGFKKKRSRWDTPSPSPQQQQPVARGGSPSAPQRGGHQARGRGRGMRGGTLQSPAANEQQQQPGWGRGKRKKRNRGRNRGGKKGK